MLKSDYAKNVDKGIDLGRTQFYKHMSIKSTAFVPI
jgi:hypothetical protein